MSRCFALGSLVSIAILGCPSSAARPRPSLVTTAERSGYVRTGRYDEALRLCHDLARAYDHVRCDEIGRSVEQRPIVAVRIARDHARPVPRIFIQAGIHAGEIEGKDA